MIEVIEINLDESLDLTEALAIAKQKISEGQPFCSFKFVGNIPTFDILIEKDFFPDHAELHRSTGKYGLFFFRL